MILIILILAVIAFIYFNVIPKKGYMPLAIISLLIAVLSIAGIVAHDYNHYGMKTQTTTVKKNWSLLHPRNCQFFYTNHLATEQKRSIYIKQKYR